MTLTRDQIRTVDRLAVERYRIPSLILMENAGRNAAELIHNSYRPPGRARIVCGTGNNGGDGYVIARHLHNARWQVRVVLVGDPSRLSDDAETNYRVVEATGLPIIVVGDPDAVPPAFQDLRADELIVDALLGTGFTGEVRRPIADVIETINAARKRAVVAVDVPSGLDCRTGRPANATIRADLTVTFVARKTAFDEATAKDYLGRVEVADIGAPPELINEVAAGRA